MNPDITIEQVRNFQLPTEGFLCSTEANIYQIEFIYFKIRNIYQKNPDGQTLLQIKKDQKQWGQPLKDQARTVKYHFGPMFFHLKTIGTTLNFRVGPQPVKNFTMIERHYFKTKLIKSYEFEVPFCIPNTINSLEAIYELPKLSSEEIEEMKNSPWQTKADSFYFAEGKLIMHNKAEFSYAPF